MQVPAVQKKEEIEPVHVLIAVADVSYANTLAHMLRSDGYATEQCHDSKGVLRLVSRKHFDIIVLELSIGDDGDVDLVTYTRRRLPNAKLMLLFELSQVERAVDAIRRGAYFYLPRTGQPSDVVLLVNKAQRTMRAEATMRDVERTLLEDMAGGSAAMRKVIEQIRKVAPTDSTVLLQGETGTGKELLAHTIHTLSARAEMPIVTVNCAALPDNLLESEMFGHVRGAFTGAEQDKKGLFEEADGGTLFLDEIGDMALITQAKLLRVLQNGEVRRVGSTTVVRVDVRVIAATNRDLEKAVANNEFREDLYFRLNVIQIRVPPLRDRMEALPALVEYFVSRFNTQYSRAVRGIDAAAQILLQNYMYPGNIRELESIVAHAVIMCDDDIIHAKDLPEQVQTSKGPNLALPNLSANSIPSLSEMEAQLIRTALERLNGNQTEAARKLGVSRSTLWRKMKEYRIES